MTDLDTKTAEVREAYQMTDDGLDFKAVARIRGEVFDDWLQAVLERDRAQQDALRAAHRATPQVLGGTGYPPEPRR